MQQVSTRVLAPLTSTDYTFEDLQRAHSATVTRREALQAITEKLQALQVSPRSPPPQPPSDLSHADVPYILYQPLLVGGRSESPIFGSRAGTAASGKANVSTAGLRRVLAPGGPEEVAMRVWESIEAQRTGAGAAPLLEARAKGAGVRTNKLKSRR